MKPRSFFLALACCATLAAVPALSAQPWMDAPHGPHHGPDPLHGVTLSEAQQQRAFAIRHAAEPLMFEQSALVRKAHDSLRALELAQPFDEARAAAAANALGSATAAQALARARVGAQVHALLTPEQRAELAQRPPMPNRR
jgi:protein CpxP